jgi:hypothetical protein
MSQWRAAEAFLKPSCTGKFNNIRKLSQPGQSGYNSRSDFPTGAGPLCLRRFIDLKSSSWTGALTSSGALAEFQRAIQMNPDFVLNHERLAHLYTYVGRFDDAISEETKARRLAGEDPKLIQTKEDALKEPPEAYINTYEVAMLYPV